MGKERAQRAPLTASFYHRAHTQRAGVCAVCACEALSGVRSAARGARVRVEGDASPRPRLSLNRRVAEGEKERTSSSHRRRRSRRFLISFLWCESSETPRHPTCGLSAAHLFSLTRRPALCHQIEESAQTPHRLPCHGDRPQAPGLLLL